MNCAFNYCVYNKESICILDDIEINCLGMCEECEIISIPEDRLEEYKNKRIEEIQSIWK